MTEKYVGFLNIKKLTRPNIIPIAARHNKREAMDSELAENIDAGSSHQNYSLRGPSSAREVSDSAKGLMAKAGTPKPRGGDTRSVLAIELVFSVPNTISFDCADYFNDCVQWAGERFGGQENILSADVHLDESNPHCHVLLLPLVSGRLNGSDMVGIGKVYADHHNSFFTDVGAAYGIEKPKRKLKGRQKESAARAVLARFHADPGAAFIACMRAFDAAVMSHPDLWAEDLGIDVEGKTLADYAISTGSGPKTRAGADSSDRRLLERKAIAVLGDDALSTPQLLSSPIGEAQQEPETTLPLSCEGKPQEARQQTSDTQASPGVDAGGLGQQQAKGIGRLAGRLRPQAVYSRPREEDGRTLHIDWETGEAWTPQEPSQAHQGWAGAV